MKHNARTLQATHYRKPTLYLVITTVLLGACVRNQTQSNDVKGDPENVQPTTRAVIDTMAHSLIEWKQSPASSDGNTVVLRFDDIILSTALEEIWTDTSYLAKTHKDTIQLELGLVNKISGQTYALKSASHVRRVDVFQNYETSVTIMDEGPHVDLINWRHFTREWRQLDVKDNQFRTIEYTTEEQEQFPDVTVAEIVQATQNHLDTPSGRWTELAQQCDSPNTYPCGVSISRINLKIVLTRDDGTTYEKYVIFVIPMGC